MVVVVDAYNVIRLFGKKTAGTQVDDSERSLFCAKMRKYAEKRKKTIKKLVLVFDGGSLAYPEKRFVGDVVEVYVGYRQIADDWIFNYVVDSRHPCCVVVSDDRGLAKKVFNFVDAVVGASDFRELVFSAMREINTHKSVALPKKTVLTEYDHMDGRSDETKDLLRILMEQSTRNVVSKKEDDAAFYDDEKIGELGKSSSKNDMRLMRILKKM
ncbi:NYN domain-containing protein [Candidatus Dependentiae bacterium]|nr:NYN domain-containing protein [Candidatus Dependentiae bacterium]